jgi:hypothetical protein
MRLSRRSYWRPGAFVLTLPTRSLISVPPFLKGLGVIFLLPAYTGV